MASAEAQQQNHAAEQARRQQAPSIGSLLRRTFEKWYGDNIPRHAAALAFYTLFAIAPLLLFSVEIMGLIYGKATAEAQLTAQIEQYVHSADAAALAQTVLDNALPSSANWFITAGIIIALIYGASAVFFELQVMLNIIWGVHLEDGGDFWQVVWDRILAIIMVIISGLLIVTGLVLTLWYSEATNWATSQLSADSNADQLSYFLLLFAVTALAFALIYKFVPAVHTAWHDVMIGAISTAFLVSIARLVITFYLSYNRMGSVFGAAGSLVILLLWVYYSAQIFFLGAEFTHVYSRTYGARRRGQVPGATGQPQRRRSNPLKRFNGRLGTSETADQSSTTAVKEAEAGQTNAPPQPLVVKAGERIKPEIEIEIINLKDHHEPKVSTEQQSAVGSAEAQQLERPEQSAEDTETKAWWRAWLSVPKFLRGASKQSEDEPLSESENVTETKVPSPELPTVPVKEEQSGMRRRMEQIVAVPLQVLRPFREIITAVGVIGALSVAVLFGFPWRRRKRQNLEQSETARIEQSATASDATETDATDQSPIT